MRILNLYKNVWLNIIGDKYGDILNSKLQCAKNVQSLIKFPLTYLAIHGYGRQFVGGFDISILAQSLNMGRSS